MCSSCRFLELDKLYPENELIWKIFVKYLSGQVFVQGYNKANKPIFRIDLVSVLKLMEIFVPRSLFEVCLDRIFLLFSLKYEI